jgi:hypothetical protein
MQKSPRNHIRVNRWPISKGLRAGQRLFGLSRLLFVFLLLGFIPPNVSDFNVEAKAVASASFPFQGEIDFRKKTFSLSLTSASKDAVSIDIAKKSDSQYHFSLNIDHLNTPFFAISSVLECPFNLTYDAHKRLDGFSGKLWSKYTLIDKRPVREFLGQFQFSNRTLVIDSLTVGNLSGQGSMRFAEPYPLNVILKLAEINIREVLNFWIKDGAGLASGQYSGEVALNGPLNRLQVKGNFAGSRGVIKDSAFDNLRINFEGVYPTVTLVNSSGIKPDGMPFTITGNFDLSDWGNFGNQFRALSKQAIVEQEGENLEWTFKRMKSQQDDGATTELKYMKKKGTGDTGMTTDEDAMLGVERSIQF